MGLFLIKRNGIRKGQCENCRDSFQLTSREITDMNRLGRFYACICSKCVDESIANSQWLERRERERVKA